MISIALNEWARLFLAKRGWLAIVAFSLVWIVFLMYVIAPAARYLSSPEMGGLIDLILGRMGSRTLSEWQSAEMGLYWMFSLFLLPFFTMVSAADQFASDKARGTMRFLVLRASRTQIFFGRFIGQYLIQLFVILITFVSVIALIAYNAPENVAAAMQEAPVVLVNLALVLLPYVALMALLSVFAKTARQATLLAIVGWIMLWFFISYIQSKFGPFPFLDWVLPGSQLTSLVRLAGWDTLSLAPIPVAHTVVLIVIGWFAMQRSDI